MTICTPNKKNRNMINLQHCNGCRAALPCQERTEVKKSNEDETLIQCQYCSVRMHYECAGFSRARAVVGDENLAWVCYDCRRKRQEDKGAISRNPLSAVVPQPIVTPKPGRAIVCLLMSDSSKDRAALLFESSSSAQEEDPTPTDMAPRSDPNDKKPSSTTVPDSDPIDEEVVGEEDLREIESVNNHLDSLNTALDAIEQRNDDIRAQLLELLNSNRAIRQELQQETRPGAGGGGALSTKEEQRATEAEGDRDDDDVDMQ